MKKLFTLIIALLLAFSATACGNVPTEETPIPTVSAEESSASPDNSCAVLSVDYASDELLADASAYSEYIADDSEYQVKAVFNTDSTINNVRILVLNLDDIIDDEDITFSAEELYTQDELTPEKPLVVGMAFAGDIPNMGISYIDSCGSEHVYSVGMSGKDGSLLLSEIILS